MIIFPAIDIRNGKCVRLTEGCFDQETIFSDSPLEIAQRWVREGAQFLHLVDLDGALAGKPINTEIIKQIVRTVDIPVQLGGGMRSYEDIEQMLNMGVNRIILGSVAVKNQDLVKKACQQYGERIVIGIDAREGQVAVQGWGVQSGIEAGMLAKEMAKMGVERIIYTDIGRDGKLSGVNIEATVELAKKSKIAIIASGGVSSIEDIKALKAVACAGIEGVIVGKAIYTGAVELKTAILAAM